MWRSCWFTVRGRAWMLKGPAGAGRPGVLTGGLRSCVLLVAGAATVWPVQEVMAREVLACAAVPMA